MLLFRLRERPDLYIKAGDCETTRALLGYVESLSDSFITRSLRREVAPRQPFDDVVVIAASM